MKKINIDKVAKRVADHIKKEDLRWASKGVFPMYIEMALDKVVPFSAERVAIQELMMHHAKKRLGNGYR